ncbi:hypothetical protein ACH5RR_032445 [Cinchona calisaya]|uniref:SET domain-containing protein n=1 Tax=Cinchona calisaya TaxID=153742 RepID=A0ABD2YND5_9GENT
MGSNYDVVADSKFLLVVPVDMFSGGARGRDWYGGQWLLKNMHVKMGIEDKRFQKCEYAKTKLFQTEGRGWVLLADEDIKAGQFIIEYCGEVISLEEAKQRSQSYKVQGLRDAYIISLNSNCFIDATNKGSLARFINHSCLPNCETRKWTVFGETQVGIFAKVDISAGTELAYNYSCEWYGGATVCSVWGC